MNLTINIGAFNSSLSRRDLLNSGGMDYLGRPVFSDVSIKVDDRSLLFINAIMTVERAFTIVKTTLQGRQGTVKEYIGAEDYRVTIAADLIPNNADKYPVSDMQKLIAIMNSQKQIEVISEFLSLFDIRYLVPDIIRVYQVAGQQSRQSVELHFLSDKDIQLNIYEESSLAPTTPKYATFND